MKIVKYVEGYLRFVGFDAKLSQRPAECIQAQLVNSLPVVNRGVTDYFQSEKPLPTLSTCRRNRQV